MHMEAKAVPGRWAGIQGGMGVESVSGPPKSNHTGSSVISLYHARRASSAKLCISRTGQVRGIRSRMARCHCGDDAPKNRQSRSVNYENKAFIAYWMSRRMGTPIAATRAPTLGTMYFTLKHGCISIYLHVHSSQSLSLASSITSWISRCYGPNLG